VTLFCISWRRAGATAVASLALLPFIGLAAPRTSADYSINAEALSVAGSRTGSSSYTNDSNTGGVAGISSAATDTVKHGYAGQLYDIVALSVTAPPSNALNENTGRQLFAAPLADDSTTLAPFDPATVTWGVIAGPIASISTGGLATAATVYQDTLATVGASTLGLTGQLALTVLNVASDDFGGYAGDGIDDAWQVQYFGENNPNAGPNADPDGDGQTNLFEYIAGNAPNDSASRFELRMTERGKLVFTPRLPDRTYAIEYRADLSNGADWAPLTGFNQSDNGSERTVVDTDASTPAKVYRVRISYP
jgi:hypothetical protein